MKNKRNGLRDVWIHVLLFIVVKCKIKGMTKPEDSRMGERMQKMRG